MKRAFALVALLAGLAVAADAQIDLGGMVKKKAEQKAKREAGKAVDKGLDEATDAITGGDDKKKDAGEQKAGSEATPEGSTEGTSEEVKAWSRYDFVPGDKVIFEDNLKGEINGEFPSRWDLLGGNAENARFGEENVISFQTSRTEITPLMKTKTYLPDIFTIEFDLYFHLKGNESYVLRFDKKNAITFRNYVVMLRQFKGNPDRALQEPGWRHIAVSFNKRALKVYFDQDRVLNIPNLGAKPEQFSLEALSHSARKGKPAMVKNIRVAEGGVKLYDRVVAEGKFVTRGIHFESGKAVVRPESHGVLNEIAAMMKEHPELRFRIEGHTDSDGEETFNLKLSRERAVAVKAELEKKGVDVSDFETHGWGESKAVDTNDTPEGKANNRRVEFVKL